MNHDDSDKRFYVYVHKDGHGNIRYVGHGTGRRYKSRTQRTKEHLDIIDDLTKEIVKDCLSKDDAISLELKYYNESISSGFLLNKNKPVGIRKISYDHISEYLEYDESSSTFLRWRKGVNYKRKLDGKEAGSFDKESGYFAVKFEGFRLKTHRVVFVLNTKSDLHSNKFIDHIDGNPSNNLFANLRLVSARDNSLNKRVNRNNSSGVSGVFFDKKSKAWVAICSHDSYQIRKNFSLVRLSKDNPNLTIEEINTLSFDMACKAREEMQQKFNIIESTLGPSIAIG